jgi:hypothetical protein
MPSNPPAKNARSILLFGICQAGHLGRILNAIPCVVNQFNVCVIENFPNPITGERYAPAPEILESCECLYFQATAADVLPSYLDPLIAQGKAQRYPILNGHPLWPAHMELHRILAKSAAEEDAQQARRLLQEPGLPWGRFPIGDRVLLDLAKTAEEESALVDRYMRLDLARMFDLDRLVQLWRRNLEAMDRSCDVPLAEVQWGEWRTARHYWSIGHPTNRLVGTLLRKLLARTIGAVPEEEFTAALRGNEFNEFMPPIHPSVARHLGLAWYSADDLYHWPDGPFTGRQWALEHVRYTRRVLAEHARLEDARPAV